MDERTVLVVADVQSFHVQHPLVQTKARLK